MALLDELGLLSVRRSGPRRARPCSLDALSVRESLPAFTKLACLDCVCGQRCDDKYEMALAIAMSALENVLLDWIINEAISLDHVKDALFRIHHIPKGT